MQFQIVIRAERQRLKHYQQMSEDKSQGNNVIFIFKRVWSEICQETSIKPLAAFYTQKGKRENSEIVNQYIVKIQSYFKCIGIVNIHRAL